MALIEAFVLAVLLEHRAAVAFVAGDHGTLDGVPPAENVMQGAGRDCGWAGIRGKPTRDSGRKILF